MKQYFKKIIIITCVATTLVFGIRIKTQDTHAIAITTLSAIVATVLVVGMGATIVADVANEQQVGTALYELGVEYGQKFGDLFDKQSTCSGPDGPYLCLERGALNTAAINMLSLLKQKFGTFKNKSLELITGTTITSELIQERTTTSSNSQAFTFTFLNNVFRENKVKYAVNGYLSMYPFVSQTTFSSKYTTRFRLNNTIVKTNQVSTENSYLRAGIYGMNGVRYISDIVDGMIVYSIANYTTRFMSIKHTFIDGTTIDDIANTNFSPDTKIELNNGIMSNWQVLTNGVNLPVIAEIDGVNYPIGQDVMDRLYTQSLSGVVVIPKGGNWTTETIDEHIGITVPAGSSVAIPKDLTSTSDNSIVLDQDTVKDLVIDEAGQPSNPGTGDGSTGAGIVSSLIAFLGGTFIQNILSPLNSIKDILHNGLWITGFIEHLTSAIANIFDTIGLKDFLTDIPFVGPIVDSIGNVVSSVGALDLTLGNLKNWLKDMPFIGPIVLGLDAIVDVIGDLSIPSVSSITDSLVSGFDGLLMRLFVPTVNPFMAILTTIQSKFPFISQITDLFMSIFNDIDVDEELPRFTINYQGNEYEIISFDLLIPYKFWIYNLSAFFIAFKFLQKTYKKIPRMITG